MRCSGETLEAEADWIATREAQYRARRKAAAEPADRSLASLLAPGGRWNQLLDATSTWGNGAELDRVSVKDNVRYEDSGTNWRLREGYGRLFEALAEGLPVALRRRGVAESTMRGPAIRLETARGTVAATRVIVTVPTSIIAGETIRFDPPLPDKLAAAAGLPLGVDDKLFISARRPAPRGRARRLPGRLDHLARDDELSGAAARPAGDLLLFRRALCRRAGARRGGGDVCLRRRRARRLFGNDIRKQLAPLAATAWQRDPWARGSYSYALPGHADDRAVLAAPVDDRLFFAGEATSPNFFSTAHGAWLSGIAAAEAALASLPPI